MNPPWLPALLVVERDEELALENLYALFEADFKVGVQVFRNARVTWDTRMMPGNRYECGFLHLVTKDGPPLMRRALDDGRAAKLRWCKAAITNCHCPSITMWDYEESTRAIRTYLWLADLDYTIVLEKRKRHGVDEYFLVTAFHIEGESKRHNLRKKYSRKIT